MGKSTKKKNKKITAPKANIQELSISRDGGQIALRGYSYQFLYSCYLILSSSNPSNFFQLEGIEDIDCIMQKNGSNDITHIQLKYSVNKQDASFLTDVLKNFLEAYLLDQNRFFKLVYDFPVAKGHLSKIFASKLDEKSRTHWAGVISNIKKNNPSWNWSVYDFDKFISHLSFEKIEKSILATEIEKTLIRIYEINTDNVSLFANSIKILCFEKMEQRAYVTKAELDSKIQSVKIDISKGPQNPAHSWIRKLDYSKPSIDEGCSFYEGKKATPADIVSGFPIKRPSLEKDVINSICENMVTVIKASSGQGKTTLALRAAYILQNEYIPYQLLWCDEIKEIGNIVQYFKARIQLGEKILILIDNLDNHLSKWNYLVQLLQSELHCHYKLLITSREMDWYNYSGDLSNIQSLKVIKPVLEEKEAIEIFNLFREAKQLHPSITSWQRAWNKIAERQLLIEYVYLLTHGEMLSERIASQISEIGQSSSGKAKCEILRKVCFADLCGVRLSAIKLSASQSEDSGSDFGELLKTKIFDGDFYTGYQSFLFEKELQTASIDKSKIAEITINNEVYDIVASNNYVVLSSGIKDLWSDIANAKNLGTIFASPYISADVKYYVVKQLREHGYTIFAYGDSKIDLYMLREADKGFLYIGKRISRSLKNESLSGLVPIYDHSLVILADEDEEVQADIAICKSNSGISGSRLAAAHVRLGEKIGRHIATVFPEKNTSILVLERGGRFFGDGVYMGAGGIFYSMNQKQDDAPVINTERVVIVDSVINTGKSIMRIIDELKNHNPGIDVIIAANVIQNEAAELFKDYLVFATRLSKNSFVGVNQSKQTGKTGPDTADRLFNLIKKRY